MAATRRRRIRGCAVLGITALFGGVIWIAAPGAALAATAPSAPVASSAPAAGGGSPVVAPVPVAPPGSKLIGSVPPATTLTADVVLRPRHATELAALAAAVSTPGSPLRGHYLTPGELRRRFAPTGAEDLLVAAKLRAIGFTVGSITPDHLTIHVSGSVARLGRAMRTSFVRYRLPGGRIAFANRTPARLSDGLASSIEAVVGLSDLARYIPLSISSRRSPAPAATARPAPAAASWAAAVSRSGRSNAAPAPCPAATGASRGAGYTANRLAGAYGMTNLYAKGDFGAGVTVGVLEFEKNAPSDVAAYESCYGLTTPVDYVKIDGGATGSAVGSGEAALDIEDVAGLAPASTIEVYQAPNNNLGPLDELQYVVDHPVANVVTTSWGECEYELAATRAASVKVARAEATLFEFAAAEGQSWLAASGDSGSTDCTPSGAPVNALAVDDPGSQPYVTSVGGTTLKLGVSSVSESVWNDSHTLDGAGGGGVSAIWRMPAYQASAPAGLHVRNAESSGRPCLAAAGYCREVPDVSASANPNHGYVVYWNGSWSVIGGTSGASPLWAAAVALTQASPRCGLRPVGFLNPGLYKVAGSAAYKTAFRDVRLGSNDYLPSGYRKGLYKAGVGYDMASGLGTPLVSSTSGGGLASSLCASLGAKRPGVDELSPSSGPAHGGNKVTIYGYGFTHVTAVYFGSAKASFRVLQARTTAPTKIVVVVPPGSGRRYVTVHNGKYTNPHTPGDRYTYTG